MIGSE